MLVGETVRKSPPRDPAFIRRLLRHFEQHRWTGAPRFLGVDEQGRETLSFIDGIVPWRQGHEPPWTRSKQSLIAVAHQEAANLVRVIADAYGLADRSALIDTVMWWQDRCWRGIEAAAGVGEPAMVRLRDSGVADAVRAAHSWTREHRDRLSPSDPSDQRTILTSHTGSVHRPLRAPLMTHRGRNMVATQPLAPR